MIYSFDGREPKLESGTYVSETATLIGDVRIGNNCYIGHGAVLLADQGTIEIGDGSAVEEAVVIHPPALGKCRIGKKVTVGHGAIIHARWIGDNATIGMGAVIGIAAKVGEGSIITENSVIRMNREIRAGVVARGNPAKVIREVSRKDLDFWILGKAYYIEMVKKYLGLGITRIG